MNEKPQTPPTAPKEIVVATSLDVPVSRVPRETITLEEYRNLGGVPVRVQEREEFHPYDVTGNADNNGFPIDIPQVLDTIRYPKTYDGVGSTRSLHARVIPQKKD